MTVNLPSTPVPVADVPAFDAGTDAEEARGRVELTAALRYAHRMGWGEAVSNHFSLALGEGGRRFLINPDGAHFALVRSPDLLLLDADDPATMDRPGAPDPTGWALHGAIHRRHPHARCALHIHSVHATALSILADPGLPPVDQNSAMFFGRVAVDPDYGGFAVGEEAERAVAHLAGPETQVLVMANHGIMVVGADVAEALNRLFFFERAAETYLKALWTGRPLRQLSDEVADRVARAADAYPGYAGAHLAAVMAILDRDEAGWRG